ncbi:DNA-binding transcriptional regulator, MarR family [Amycolatopsis marina]|uniref:DNA-binding transcriptional regulator, MarR family n=1 Tax=Amycolatopsis marina TaxID=490629 RepID=A0A1I0XVY8_9PSEU|nr:MarR family transcriptional regulator [Amycolatopsis marina]SFB05162.1 DNA-binding transcriptional regulator, MarR family [Amycolatopsis marina]
MSTTHPTHLVTSSTGYLMLRLADVIHQRIESLLGQWNLTGRDLRVLSFAYAQPLSQRELCQLAGLDRTTMVAVVDKLEDLGLACRERGSDRRKYIVTLTSHGRAIAEDAIEQLATAEAEFLQPISRAEQQQFHALLTSLFQAHDPTC